jgi:hypothetical protein
LLSSLRVYLYNFRALLKARGTCELSQLSQRISPAMHFSSLLSVAVLFGTALSATNLTVLLQYPACAVSPYPMLHLEAPILTHRCRRSVLVRSWQSPNAHCLIFHNVYVPTRLYNMPLQFASSAHAISRNKLACSSVSHQSLCLGGNLILMRGNSIVDPYAK